MEKCRILENKRKKSIMIKCLFTVFSVLALAYTPIYAQRDFSTIEIKTIPVRDSI